jgi:hypothetical protein
VGGKGGASAALKGRSSREEHAFVVFPLGLEEDGEEVLDCPLMDRG